MDWHPSQDVLPFWAQCSQDRLCIPRDPDKDRLFTEDEWKSSWYLLDMIGEAHKKNVILHNYLPD